jgi:hypothetical protein
MKQMNILAGLSTLLLAAAACNLSVGTPVSPEPTVISKLSTVMVDEEDLAGEHAGRDEGVQKIETQHVPTATEQPEAECTNLASFIDDLTIPDGTALGLSTGFVKSWRVRNSGTCAWNSDYSLMFVNGHRLNGPTLISLAESVSPGQTLDLSVGLKAPDSEGLYQSFWMLRDPTGRLFGVGDDADTPIWIKLYAGLLPDVDGWKGEYYSNKELSGEPERLRDDDSIEFNWKFNAPLAGIPINDFSVRWSQELSFDPAIYRFTVQADDGIRLWIDGVVVIDQWRDGSFRKFTADVWMNKGKHDIVLEYYERSGVAKIELDWGKIDTDDFRGWTAMYWPKPDFKADWALVIDHDKIDFDWGQNAPAASIPKDDFSIQWERTLSFESGRYRFSVRADDGIKFFIDGTKVLDEWHDSDASRVYTVDADLDGSHTLEVEYYEHKKHALIKLWWDQIEIPNEAPQGQDDAYALQEDIVLAVTAPGVLANDSDPEGNSLSAIVVQAPAHGQIYLQPDGSFTFTPDLDFNGPDSFTYRASDGDLETAEISVMMEISAVNDTPIAVSDVIVTDEDHAVTIDAIANDLGLGDAPLSIQVIGEPSQGSLSVNPDLSLQYLPYSHANGLDAFTYEVTDADGEKASAVVEVTINPIDDNPEVSDDSFSVQQGQDLDVTAGNLTLGADGSLTYVPEAGFAGTVTFSYRATDGTNSSSVAFVDIEVLP